MSASISVIIRTYNEARHIAQLVEAINNQVYDGDIELIVVDSGSTDGTVAIANCLPHVRVVSIPKEAFSYGYALNYGLNHASGDIAISISAHCTPVGKYWLASLVAPLTARHVAIAYGRQIGTLKSRLSEKRIFEENFPREASKYAKTIYNHNGNSAFRVAVWRDCPFDEKLQGLEDLDFAKRAAQKGFQSVYVPDATVFHFHLETNEKVFNRYYREVVALKNINPQEHMGRVVLVVGLCKSLTGDYFVACREGRIRKVFFGVLGYRLSQYLGMYLAYHGAAQSRVGYHAQNWVLKKISHGASDVLRLQQDGVLRRAA